MPVTQKGQVTIPKKFRDYLGLEKDSKVEFEKSSQGVVVKKAPSIFDFAGKFKLPKGVNTMDSREYMENNYERV